LTARGAAPTIARAAALHEKAIRLSQQSRTREAAQACSAAVDIFRKVSGPRHLDTAHALVELGDLLTDLGQLARARRCLALAAPPLARAAAGATASEEVRRLSLWCVRARGRVWASMGHHGRAALAFRRLQRLSVAYFGSRDLAVADAKNQLAILSKALGRYHVAHRLYLEARPLILASAGVRSHQYASLCHNLAGIEHALGKLPEAERHARAGLRIRRTLTPPHRPDVASDHSALAVVLHDRGKWTEAAALLRGAISYYRQAFGPWAHEVALGLGNLATVCRSRGDLGRAERYLREAVAIERRLHGVRHPEVGLWLGNLAVVVRDRGRDAEARPLGARALAILRATVGARHPHTRSLHRALAGRQPSRGRRRFPVVSRQK
jgi:tetratricopeptide (TPR) repeat protein